MAEFEGRIIRGIEGGQLPPVAGGDGTPEGFVSKAAIKRLVEEGREARRVAVALDVASNWHGYSRTVRRGR